MNTIPPSRPFVYLLAYALLVGVSEAVVTDQFTSWYSQFRGPFERIKKEHCSREWDDYRSGKVKSYNISVDAGADEFTVLTQPLIDCLLENTGEFIKANMTGAQVLLGVMPTVLSLLSASVDELAMVMTVSRRPILALLLAFGSPSAYFSRAFSYPTAHEILNRHPDRKTLWQPKTSSQKIITSALQYVAIFALAANVLHCAWEVGIRAVSSILSHSAFLPPMWVGAGVFVQLMGVCVFRLRVQGWRDVPGSCQRRSMEKDRRTHHEWRTFGKWLTATPRRLWDFRRTEFVPSAEQGFEVRMATYPQRKIFLVSAWFQSTIAVLHVVFGTLTFSSMIFIGTIDALAIVSRFFVSTLICRIVIRYELAGLRDVCVDISSANDPEVGADHHALHEVGVRNRKVSTLEIGETSSNTTGAFQR